MSLTREQAKEIGKIRNTVKDKADILEKVLKDCSTEELAKMGEELRTRKLKLETPQKSEVINFPQIQKVEGKTEAEIKNWPDIFKVAGEVIAKVAFPVVQKITGAVTAKVENWPAIQKVVGLVTAKIENFPEIQKVEITNPTEKMYVEGRTEIANLPLGKADKEGDPEKFVGVRLTSGKRYYDLDQILVGGGGLPSAKVKNFMDSAGKESSALVDTAHHLQVDVLSGGGGGTQYDEGDIDATITGTAILWEDASNTLRAISAAKPLPVDITDASIAVTGTFWQETQPVSGTVTVSGQVTANLGTVGGLATEVTLNTLSDKFVSGTDIGDVTINNAVGAGVYIRPGTGINLDTSDVTITTFPDNEPFNVAQYGGVAVGAANAIHVQGGTGAIFSVDATGQGDVPITLDGEQVTVSGTVTLGAGALEIGKVKLTDGVEMASVNTSNQLEVAEANSTAIKTAVEIIDNAISGSEMQVDIVADGAGLALAANQLADGHNVTIDNASSNEVYVRGSGTAGSADAAVLTVQGIASGTALAVTESSPISGFATSAKQLADGHNVTVDNAGSAAAVNIQDGGNTITVDTTGTSGLEVVQGTAADLKATVTQAGTVTVSGTVSLGAGDLEIGKVKINDGVETASVNTLNQLEVVTNHPITGIGHGVTTVTTAGADVVLAASTACKRVTIQAQTDNTGWIAVGASGVDATEATGTGVLLGAGDSFELEIDNLADIYIDSTVNGEGVRYTYFT